MVKVMASWTGPRPACRWPAWCQCRWPAWCQCRVVAEYLLTYVPVPVPVPVPVLPGTRSRPDATEHLDPAAVSRRRSLFLRRVIRGVRAGFASPPTALRHTHVDGPDQTDPAPGARGPLEHGKPVGALAWRLRRLGRRAHQGADQGAGEQRSDRKGDGGSLAPAGGGPGGGRVSAGRG